MNGARLASWMDSEKLGTGAIADVMQLPGGTQNLVLRFRRGSREFVLRRPSLTPRPGGDRIMLREARLLAAISQTPVPHPRLLAQCDDPSVLGCAFYLMEPVDGFNPTVAMPPAALGDRQIRERMGYELVEGLATLADLDPEQLGLGDFGKIDNWLSRQVGRWRSEYEGYSRYAEWTGHRDITGLDRAAQWLDRHVPDDLWTGIMHGDFHIGNAIFGPAGNLLAIIDWEMATLGDPMLDLSRFLISWPDGNSPRPYTMRVSPLDGFPSPEQMAQRFADVTGQNLDRLPWFEVLARFKLGIILEGSYVRAQGGEADPAIGERLHRSAIALFDDIDARIAG